MLTSWSLHPNERNRGGKLVKEGTKEKVNPETVKRKAGDTIEDIEWSVCPSDGVTEKASPREVTLELRVLRPVPAAKVGKRFAVFREPERGHVVPSLFWFYSSWS